ncbi:family 3 encapsulin nanocompartment shell protein [Solwaraspora sp. WMMD406]|uniref:family 3 encapsulin nanocompartment shell protein n=1 Tax=Solwaraspora sp. WMMD406 TaxID=3016095 RepID=UPI002417AA36|nr:family 3 encapsulin nanocompartment shell protein [Solwaraspora sp. WMMD406]MDG4766020.1 family 3 encapsulin nanocompartment shell protein [Solwaraspora sp. WMMD406]
MAAESPRTAAQAGATAASDGDVPSPGQLFAAAYLADPHHAEVRFDYTITEAFQPTAQRPRITVRNLLRSQPVTTDTVRIWSESRGEYPDRVHESRLRREAAFRFGTTEARVRPIRAWVQVPDELAADPQALAVFIDHRLLVRLATAENQALTIGEYGLLRNRQIARLPYRGDYVTGLLTACDEIEQTGATAHGMIVNPQDYYFHLVGRGVLADLTSNGVRISRTRMVPPGTALVGDFAMAARLLDAGRSAIRVDDPPPGTFATDGRAVCAEVHEGLAVHLPTHFFLVVPAGQES